MPTAIGDVVPALVSVFTTALSPVVVYSGPKPTADYAQEYLCVAFDPEGAEAVTTEQEISPMGNRWVQEDGTVTCSITCWSGDDDFAALLVRADDLLDLADAALVANPTLGVLSSGNFARVLGRTSMTQTSDGTGSLVRLAFTVTYSSLLT